MGYDYPECIGCYCIRGFNEGSDMNMAICIDCFRNFTSLSGRARHYGDEVYSRNVSCEVCYKEGEGYKSMPLCMFHERKLREVNRRKHTTE